MQPEANAYALPPALDADLARLESYWRDLIRGENSMPFADDIDIRQLPELAGRALLLSAFENPDRFRFEIVGDQIERRVGMSLKGKFSDEVPQEGPLSGLTEQCKATIERRAPTYDCSAASGGVSASVRLLLPCWGEGHIMSLLGTVTETQQQG